jgi:predicted transcriptional regulator
MKHGQVNIFVRHDGDMETDGAHQLAFENWPLLARVLTGKRVELLRHVRRHQAASVRALAKALGRDYRNVHSDVQTLIRVGLLDTSANGLRVDYDVIETKITI